MYKYIYKLNLCAGDARVMTDLLSAKRVLIIEIVYRRTFLWQFNADGLLEKEARVFCQRLG